MEPDDLLCSRNARSRTPLVGRAQWKINQSPYLRDNERAWREHLFVRRAQSRIDQATLENEIVEEIARAEEGIGSDQVPFLLAERAHSESARSMRAIKGSLGHSLNRGLANWKVCQWVGEKVSHSGRSISPRP